MSLLKLTIQYSLICLHSQLDVVQNKILTVSMLCLDERDRTFNMEFEPKSVILSGPDRQTVFFSVNAHFQLRSFPTTCQVSPPLSNT